MTPTCMTTLLAGALFLALTPSSASALDADPWDEVLQAHARQGGVDYAALKADDEAMAKLDAFLAAVGRMPESAGLADWLNAYNAIVVKSVLDAYPLRSVREVDGFFDGKRHRVAGAQRTLDDIENRIIRPRFEDARVHFALNCAAKSCPALHGRAFRQGSLDQTLDRLVRRAVASPRHVRVADGSLEVSEIFHWFSGDFERDGGSIRGWIAGQGVDLSGVPESAEVGRIGYDWRLNDV
jgi:hypothetical protein